MTPHPTPGLPASGWQSQDSHPGLCASRPGGPILPLVSTCGLRPVARPSQGRPAVYLTSEPAEPASSRAPRGAPAGPFLPRPGAPAGVPGAGSGGCGWIPSSSAPLWPVGESGRKWAQRKTCPLCQVPPLRQGPLSTHHSSVEGLLGY